LVVPPSTAEQDHPATSRIAVGSLRDSGTWVFSVRMEKDYPHPQTVHRPVVPPANGMTTITTCSPTAKLSAAS